MTPWYLIGLSAALALVGGAVLVRTTLVVVTVRGSSMSPTFHDGDRVLALRAWPSRWLRKEQLVLVHTSLVPARQGKRSLGEPLSLKRVTGLPGDTMDNREFLQAPPRDLPRDLPRAAPLPPPPEQWHVPSDHVFVCGDNRSTSMDSRSYGPLSFSCVVGVVLMRLPPHDA